MVQTSLPIRRSFFLNFFYCFHETQHLPKCRLMEPSECVLQQQMAPSLATGADSPKSPQHFLQRANSGPHRVKSNQAPAGCQLGVGCHPSTNPPHFARKQDRWLLSLSCGVIVFCRIISRTRKWFSLSSPFIFLLLFFSSIVGWFSGFAPQLQTSQTSSIG